MIQSFESIEWRPHLVSFKHQACPGWVVLPSDGDLLRLLSGGQRRRGQGRAPGDRGCWSARRRHQGRPGALRQRWEDGKPLCAEVWNWTCVARTAVARTITLTLTLTLTLTIILTLSWTTTFLPDALGQGCQTQVRLRAGTDQMLLSGGRTKKHHKNTLKLLQLLVQLSGYL